MRVIVFGDATRAGSGREALAFRSKGVFDLSNGGIERPSPSGLGYLPVSVTLVFG